MTQGFDSGVLGCADDCDAFDTSQCFLCGDGAINGTESCDGNLLDGETCISLGLEGGVLGCANDCSFDLTACFGCGNGERDGNEACDGVDFGGTSCVGLGWDGGTPTCNPDCTIDDISCFGEHTFCTSPGLPIGPGAAALTLSTIPVAGLAGDVLDVDVFLDATHSRVSDLNIDVRYVDGDLSVSLVDDQCGVSNDILATFDQDAPGAPDCIEPIAIQGDVLPLGSLDAYVGTIGAGNGTWELTVLDEVNAEGGNLAQWCVAVTTGSETGSLITVRTGDGMVRALDPVSLTFTDIGPLGVGYDFGEVAWDSLTGTLWMIDGRPLEALYTVDLQSGAAALVGVHGVQDLFGLEHDPTSGLLYATGFSPLTQLYTIDQGTGAAVLVGDTGLSGDGLAYDSLRNQLVALEGGGGTLYSIDPGDASVVVLSQEGFINNCGLAYEPVGDLYWAIDWSGDLYSYDPNDGYSRTLQLNGQGAHDGLTFVPGFVPD